MNGLFILIFKKFNFFFKFLVSIVSLKVYNFLTAVTDLLLSFFLSPSLLFFFFKFLRISYLLWLETLVIDFLQKKSFHNFIKSYILLSPDFIENFVFKFLSNPITDKVTPLYRLFLFKESSSTYSFFLLTYFLIISLLTLLILNYTLCITLLF